MQNLLYTLVRVPYGKTKLAYQMYVSRNYMEVEWIIPGKVLNCVSDVFQKPLPTFSVKIFVCEDCEIYLGEKIQRRILVLVIYSVLHPAIS